MKCEPTVALRADVLYRAPSGRLCRWVPPSGEHRQITAFGQFEYLRREQRGARQALPDGFVLAPANYRLLREVPGVLHEVVR